MGDDGWREATDHMGCRMDIRGPSDRPDAVIRRDVRDGLVWTVRRSDGTTFGGRAPDWAAARREADAEAARGSGAALATAAMESQFADALGLPEGTSWAISLATLRGKLDMLATLRVEYRHLVEGGGEEAPKLRDLLAEVLAVEERHGCSPGPELVQRIRTTLGGSHADDWFVVSHGPGRFTAYCPSCWDRRHEWMTAHPNQSGDAVVRIPASALPVRVCRRCEFNRRPTPSSPLARY